VAGEGAVSALAFLPTQAAVDAAWERYAALATQMRDDPRLLADRAHVEATTRAHREFTEAFNAMEARG
jgi:hypothetical protein